MLTVAITALIAACAGGTQPTVPVGTGTVPPIAGPITPPSQAGAIKYTSSGHKEMDAWREDFSSRALAQGRDRAVVESVLTGISPISRYLGKNLQTAGTGVGDQAEFAKPIWEYLRTAVSDTRKTKGADRLVEEAALFTQLEARYGVNREVLAAIWGMETNYGSYIGTFDAGNTLSNMAVEGRRRKFAEGELLGVMKIIEDGYADRDDLISGWAGAMGQTQFMPTTYLAHAQDFEGDGKIDVWNSRADALASAANYLARSGYQMDQPWGIEVLLPAGFDYALADGQERRVTSWQTSGVSPIRGGTFNTGGASYAELWVPAGATGPKFLLFKNFNVFKTYNRADSYALAVGMLSEGVAGQDGPVAAWPTQVKLLSKAQIKELQASLNSQGFDAGPVDGIAGRGTKGALRKWQKANGLIADGFPTQQMLAYVTGRERPQVSSLISTPG